MPAALWPVEQPPHFYMTIRTIYFQVLDWRVAAGLLICSRIVQAAERDQARGKSRVPESDRMSFGRNSLASGPMLDVLVNRISCRRAQGKESWREVLRIEFVTAINRKHGPWPAANSSLTS